MPRGCFLLTIARGRKPELDLDYDFEKRADVSVARNDSATALVLGSLIVDSAGDWADSGMILEAYERSLTADRLTGFANDFAAVIADGANRSCTVVTSRFFCPPVFYARLKDKLFVSDSMLRVAEVLGRVHLDPAALIQYLHFGFLFGERTHFDEIKKLRPASVLSADDEMSVCVYSYWKPGGSEPSRDPGILEETAARFRESIESALSLSGHAALPLTAGFDSRSILAASPPKKEGIACHTYGSRRQQDVVIARKLCAGVGVPLTTYEYEAEDIEEGMTSVATATNGLVNFLLFCLLERVFAAESSRCGMLLPGMGGEMFRMRVARQRPGGLSCREDIIFNFTERYGRNTSPDVIRGYDGIAKDEIIAESLEGELNRFESMDLIAQSEGLYLENRIANFISVAFGAARRYMRLWDPWLRESLIDMVPRLDPELKSTDMVHRCVIESCGKELANVVVGKGLLPAGTRWMSNSARVGSLLSRGRDFGYKALNKTVRMVAGTEPVSRFVETDAAKLLVNRRPDLIDRFLDAGSMRLADFIDPAALERDVELFKHGHSDLCYILTNIICLEIWLDVIGRHAEVSVA